MPWPLPHLIARRTPAHAGAMMLRPAGKKSPPRADPQPTPAARATRAARAGRPAPLAPAAVALSAGHPRRPAAENLIQSP